jgi:Mor family transcriptional regulator/very-short-patch-repair endonuclease
MVFNVESKIKELRLSGDSLQTIANKLNISKSTVYRIIERFKINKPELPSNEIISAYKNGMSVLQLSKKYNCSRSKIQKVLDTNKIQKQRNRKTITLNKELCDGDFSIKNIMKTHNVSKNTAIKLRKKSNIKTNNSILELDVDKIKHLHINEKMSASELANEFNCYYGTIINKLGNEYNPNLHRSQFEQKIQTLLESNNIKYKRNTRTVISPKELDFYTPEYNLALEVNGLYWHCEISGGKDKSYHYNKYKECQNKNITLMQFTDIEIAEKWDIISSMILHKINKTENKIPARKTTFRKVEFSEMKRFMENNHISGHAIFSNGYGLYYDDVLVCGITTIKNRFEKNEQHEIVRFATKLNTVVVGGLSKLLNHIPEKELVTYSNNMYGDGMGYEKTGFNYISETKPGYKYYKDGILYSRQTFQKYKLKDKLEHFNSDISEWENMKLNGYDRVWDCGHKKYIK